MSCRKMAESLAIARYMCLPGKKEVNRKQTGLDGWSISEWFIPSLCGHMALARGYSDAWQNLL